MAIRIGHASIDENRKANSGVAGDQTGKEVCIRDWYDSSWHTVIRCDDPEKAELMAKACEAACKNPNVGYDQYQRNTLRNAARIAKWDLSKVGKCECDCSSLMAVCAECAGIEIPYRNGNAPTTRTMENDFESTNMFRSFMFTTSKVLKRGDIVLKDGHVVMVLEGVFETVNVAVEVLKKGVKSDSVKTLQILLNGYGFNCGEVDGSFGSNTDKAVRNFQKANKLEVDGSVGKNTWTALLQGGN